MEAMRVGVASVKRGFRYALVGAVAVSAFTIIMAIVFDLDWQGLSESVLSAITTGGWEHLRARLRRDVRRR